MSRLCVSCGTRSRQPHSVTTPRRRTGSANLLSRLILIPDSSSRELSEYFDDGPPLLFLGRNFFLVEIVVLVVLRALQGQLEGESILGDLIDPHTGCNLGCSRVSSTLLTCFGRSVRLCGTGPAGVEKVCQRLIVFKQEDHAIVLYA